MRNLGFISRAETNLRVELRFNQPFELNLDKIFPGEGEFSIKSISKYWNGNFSQNVASLLGQSIDNHVLRFAGIEPYRFWDDDPDHYRRLSIGLQRGDKQYSLYIHLVEEYNLSVNRPVALVKDMVRIAPATGFWLPRHSSSPNAPLQPVGTRHLLTLKQGGQGEARVSVHSPLYLSPGDKFALSDGHTGVIDTVQPVEFNYNGERIGSFITVVDISSHESEDYACIKETPETVQGGSVIRFETCKTPPAGATHFWVAREEFTEEEVGSWDVQDGPVANFAVPNQNLSIAVTLATTYKGHTHAVTRRLKVTHAS